MDLNSEHGKQQAPSHPTIQFLQQIPKSAPELVLRSTLGQIFLKNNVFTNLNMSIAPLIFEQIFYLNASQSIKRDNQSRQKFSMFSEVRGAHLHEAFFQSTKDGF